MIAFDPERDFTVLPWLATAPDRGLRRGEVLLGGRREERVGDSIPICGMELTAYGQLESTGVGPFDRGLFVTYETAADLAEACRERAVGGLVYDPRPGLGTACPACRRDDPGARSVRSRSAARSEGGLGRFAGHLDPSRGVVPAGRGAGPRARVPRDRRDAGGSLVLGDRGRAIPRNRPALGTGQPRSARRLDVPRRGVGHDRTGRAARRGRGRRSACWPSAVRSDMRSRWPGSDSSGRHRR